MILETTKQLDFGTLGKINIKYPNVGEAIQIESLKLAYSNNQYPLMLRNMTTTNAFVLDAIDTVATFSVLIPKFKETLLSGESYEKMDLIAIKPFIKVYRKQFLPWWSELEKQLYDIEDEQDDVLLEKQKKEVAENDK